MNWKNRLRLPDLDSGERLEITCRCCGKGRYETPEGLLTRRGFRCLYLDEVEHALRCRDRFCGGAVRLALIHPGKVEGFTGGMA